MLRNQEAEQPSQTPSGQTPSSQTPSGAPRVTPDELNAALAAIEARRQADAGTIPIDQAVSELHLDSTSDEIWAEVKSHRAKAAAEGEKLPSAQTVQAPQITARSEKHRHGWLTMFTPILIGWVLLQTGVIPHFWNHSTHISAPVLRPLSVIPDGTQVYADDSALVQVSEDKPMKQIVVSENATGNRWPIVKMNGHIYLHGYIASTDSLALLQGKALNVYNDDDSGELKGESTSNITLRVDDIPLQKSSGDDDFSGITFPNFQPDPLTTLSPWH